MKKNKIYIILVILAIISLFSFAALCNPNEAVNDNPIDESDDEEAAADQTDTTSTEDTTGKEDEEVNQEDTIEEEEETPEQEEQKEAPAITLEIYEGPIYSSSDNVCYYRVKAIVTGNPTPSVVFSKDDSGGAWGSKKTQINIGDSTETYTLTATTTNSEGSATDSIALSWGCPITNNPPEISGITLIPGNYAPNIEYPIPVVASDPDGDNLSYNSFSATDPIIALVSSFLLISKV